MHSDSIAQSEFHGVMPDDWMCDRGLWQFLRHPADTSLSHTTSNWPTPLFPNKMESDEDGQRYGSHLDWDEFRVCQSEAYGYLTRDPHLRLEVRNILVNKLDAAPAALVTRSRNRVWIYIYHTYPVYLPVDRSRDARPSRGRWCLQDALLLCWIAWWNQLGWLQTCTIIHRSILEFLLVFLKSGVTKDAQNESQICQIFQKRRPWFFPHLWSSWGLLQC